MAALKDLPNFTELDFGYYDHEREFQWNGLAALGRLRSLRLSLAWYAQYSEELNRIESLRERELEELRLVAFRDFGVPNTALHPQNFPKLRVLQAMGGQPVTDETLLDLEALKSLRVLRLDRTRVRAEAVADLQAKRPDLTIKGGPLRSRSPQNQPTSP